jgi:hypothetical protein
MASGFTHESQAANTIEWYTPPWVFQKLGTEFDLDPCSPENGLLWIPTKKFYDEKQNGLELPWEGKVWMNPPYGREIVKWMDKFVSHNNGICLTFARTDTVWGQKALKNATAVCFIAKRIAFVTKELKKGASAPAPSMMLAMGDACAETLLKSNIEGIMIDLRKGRPA